MEDKIVEAPKKHLDLLKKSLLRFPKNYVPFLIILIALPVSVVLALTAQEIRSHAGGYDFATIQVNPGSVEAKVGDKIPISALGYDSQNNPIFGVQDYSWSMSSTNTVGTLTQSAGKTNEFDALKEGCGEITVSGNWNGITVTKGISVGVSDDNMVPDCGSSTTPTPTPYPPILLASHQITITNYYPEVLAIAGGEEVRFMTITSKYDQNISFYGYPTSYGPGINYVEANGFLKANIPQDFYISAISTVPAGEYTGTPTLNTYYDQRNTSLPTTKVKVSNPPTPTLTDTPTPTPSPTLTPTPTPGQNTFHSLKIYPTADSYVRKDKPNTNYGTSGELIADGSPVSISYLRFNIPDLTGKKIVEADLVLRVPNVTGAETHGTVRLKTTGSNWTEKGITYSNRPSVGSSIASLPKLHKQTTYGLSINGYIQGQSNKTINLALDTASGDGAIFRSKEGGSSTRPYIEIDYYQ